MPVSFCRGFAAIDSPIINRMDFYLGEGELMLPLVLVLARWKAKEKKSNSTDEMKMNEIG